MAYKEVPQPPKRMTTPTPFPPITRTVTGHHADGRATVSSHGPLPVVTDIAAIPGTVFHEVWATQGSPVSVDNGADPTLGPLQLRPPAQGTRIRFVDIPPEAQGQMAHNAAQVREAFHQIGDAAAATSHAGSPHPLMHRTESVDYGVVMEGEITLVLEDSEVLLRKGSVVVQRGTNHAWANRSGQPCRMLFVLVDGRYDPAVAPQPDTHLRS
jgi:mannose-6-phosphate isomerase-like protein (cupin superfamily)